MNLISWERNNEFFDDLPKNEFEALKKDISENGILNPLHITPHGVVICGNQRLKACRALGIPDANIPTKIIDLPADELIIYAIKDNILRRQLTPEQKAKPVAVMVKLLDKLKEQRKKHADQNDQHKGKLSREIVAEQLGIGSGGTLHRLILYNKIVEENPEYKGEKVNVAIKKYRKQKQIEEFKSKVSGKVYNNVLNGDCTELIKQVADNSIDCILTDPPYGIDMKSVRGAGTNDFEDDSKENAINLMKKMLPEYNRVLKDNSHVYIFCSWHNLGEFKEIISKYFEINNVLVWHKNKHTNTNFDYKYAHKYELIIFATKGKRPLNNKITYDVLEVANLSGKTHNSEKPVDLIKILIENSTHAGEVVLDPFFGSGSTLVAAKQLNRNYIGIELDKHFYNMAISRLEDAQLELGGFRKNYEG